MNLLHNGSSCAGSRIKGSGSSCAGSTNTTGGCLVHEDCFAEEEDVSAMGFSRDSLGNIYSSKCGIKYFEDENTTELKLVQVKGYFDGRIAYPASVMSTDVEAAEEENPGIGAKIV